LVGTGAATGFFVAVVFLVVAGAALCPWTAAATMKRADNNAKTVPANSFLLIFMAFLDFYS
jgi:hypothetical protein